MKTPGQKAYEAARGALLQYSSLIPAWETLQRTWQIEWEAVAAAVMAPEPKTYGEVAREAYARADNWEEIAQATINEFKLREGLK